MSILQFPTPIPMTNGQFPQFKFAVFTDGLSTITTAGYLNSSSIESGIPLSNADVIMALYNFNQNTNTGGFAIFTVNIAASNGQITLTEWGNPGDVVLPTIANYIGHFTDTAGTLSSGNANVINAGNIQAGLSGVAGALSSFPGTASKGSLKIAAVANTGNTITTLANNPMGQATTVNIPDPGNAIGQLCIGASATPFVNGNLIIASGTAGKLADSGLNSENIMFEDGANVMTSTGSITLHKVSGVESTNAVTANGNAGFITTSVLDILAGDNYAITWTNSFITSTSVINLTVNGGTIGDGLHYFTFGCTPGTGTATLTIYNIGPTATIAGTVIFGYTVL
jgi:hypothetical protein